MVSSLGQWLASIHVPGRVFFSVGWRAYWDSLRESVIIFLLATSPISVRALVKISQNTESPKDFEMYFDIMKESLLRGELFLYCTSILATVFWLSVKDWKNNRFPYRISFSFGCLVGIALSLVFFVMDLVGAPFDQEFVFSISELFFAFSWLAYFLISVLGNATLPNLKERTASDAKALTEQLRQQRTDESP